MKTILSLPIFTKKVIPFVFINKDNSKLKRLIQLSTILLLFSCTNEQKKEITFSDFAKSIPEIKLPYNSSSVSDPENYIEPDSIYRNFSDENANGIIGKININDSVVGILYAVAGDNVFPLLKTYSASGKTIDEIVLVHLPGGSTGFDANGSSYMTLNEKFEIGIMDSTFSFSRDSSDVIIESSRDTTITLENYKIEPTGKLNKIIK